MSTIPTGTRACRHCGRQIAWVRVAATGKPMPLDLESDRTGNVFVTNSNGHLTAAVARRGETLPGIAFMPHFVTCPVLNKGKVHTTPKPPSDPPPEQFALDL